MWSVAISAGSVCLLVVTIILFSVLKRKKCVTTVPGLDPVDATRGSFPDIARAGSIGEFLQELHDKYGPIARMWWGPKLVISISSPELLKQVSGIFDRPVELFGMFEPLIGKGSVQLLNGDVARTIHSRTSRCFSSNLLHHYFDLFNKSSNELINNWKRLPADDHIPVRERCMSLAIDIMLKAILGDYFHDDSRVKIIKQSYYAVWREIERRVQGDNPDDSRLQIFKENKSALYKVAKEAWVYRKEHPATSGEYLIIDALTDLDMSKADTLNNIVTFMIGGFHSSGLLMTWVLYYLATNKDVQEKLHKEVSTVVGRNQSVEPEHIKHLKYTQQIISEAMRCRNLAAFAARVQACELQLGGHKIPANTPVLMALCVQGRDQKYYPNPDKFDPDRFSAENVKKRPSFSFEPFGFAGKRKCPGYRFVTSEVPVILANVVRHFEVAVPGDQIVTPVNGLLTTPKDEIWMTVKTRAQE